MICMIVGAGPLFDYDLSKVRSDFIIAADGGYDHLMKFNITPNVLVGDMDSVKPNNSTKRITFPKEKDQTDMMLAVMHGMAQGHKSFRIYGGTGGRSEHTFANIAVLAYIAKCGGDSVLYGDGYTATVINRTAVRFDPKTRGYLSVFAYGGSAIGVTETGLKYPLSNAVLNCDNPIGVSNEFLPNRSATVSVTQGMLLIIHTPSPDGD